MQINNQEFYLYEFLKDKLRLTPLKITKKEENKYYFKCSSYDGSFLEEEIGVVQRDVEVPPYLLLKEKNLSLAKELFVDYLNNCKEKTIEKWKAYCDERTKEYDNMII